MVKSAEEEAAKMVHTKLTQMYKELDPWRNKELADPYGAAQKAGGSAPRCEANGACNHDLKRLRTPQNREKFTENTT